MDMEAIMMEAFPKPKRGRPKKIGGLPALKKRRQEYDKCRNASKITIGLAKDDWDNLRVDLGLDSNETLAICLIDSFKRLRAITSSPSVYDGLSVKNDLVPEGTSVSPMSNYSAKVNESSQGCETDRPGHDDMELHQCSRSPDQLHKDTHHLQSTTVDKSIQKDQLIAKPPLPRASTTEAVLGRGDDDYESDDRDDDNMEGPCHPGVWQSVQKVDVTASSALCFFDNLITLAKITPPTRCKHKDCSSPVQMLLQEEGTAVHMLWKCGQGHESLRWTSQPVLKGGFHLGNIMLCAAAVFSGNNYAKTEMLCRQLNLGVPSKQTFQRLQGKYIAPHIEKT